MTTITGTVVETRSGKGLTIVDLKTGENGGERIERLVIAGLPRLPRGTPIRATGVIRRDGAYCLDRGGRLEAIGAPSYHADGAPEARPAAVEPLRPRPATAPHPKTTALARRDPRTELPAVAHLLPQVNPSAAALIKKGLTLEQIAVLQGYTPERFLQIRKIRGGEVVTFVDNHYVIAALNFVFGHTWAEEYDAPLIQGDHAATRCRLTVTFPDGSTATRTATGGHPIARYTYGDHKGEVIDLGDAIKAAEADAVKKAASKFGIAWDVYAGVTVHPQATKGGKTIYQVVEERERIVEASAEVTVSATAETRAASAPTVEAKAHPRPASTPSATTPSAEPRPAPLTAQQVEFALKAFDGDVTAILAAAEARTAAGDPVPTKVEEIPLNVIREIVLTRLNRAKADRAAAAAAA